MFFAYNSENIIDTTQVCIKLKYKLVYCGHFGINFIALCAIKHDIGLCCMYE